jgi:micrococcal nuclease
MANLFSYQATVIRVVDGDTIKVEIDLGFRVKIDIVARLARINAPELKTPEGEAAKAALAIKLLPGTLVHLQSKGVDRYGRSIAEVTVNVAGQGEQNLSDHLVQLGLARYQKY